MTQTATHLNDLNSAPRQTPLQKARAFFAAFLARQADARILSHMNDRALADLGLSRAVDSRSHFFR